MVNASTLKSPVLLAVVIMGGLSVLASIIGLFALAAIRDGPVADQLVVTFTGLLGIAFGGAGPVITHMIYALSGVPQPGQGSDTTSTTTITTGQSQQGA